MNVVVVIEGGNIVEVIADHDVKVTIVDYDTEGAHLDDLSYVEGKDAYVYKGITEAEVNPLRVMEMRDEAGVSLDNK